MYRIISSHLYYIVWNYNNDFECRKWMFNYKSYYLFFTWFPFKDVLLCPNFVLPIINGGGVIFWFHQIWKRVWKIHCCLFVESVRPFVVSFPGKLMGGFLFIKLVFDKWKKVRKLGIENYYLAKIWQVRWYSIETYLIVTFIFKENR